MPTALQLLQDQSSPTAYKTSKAMPFLIQRALKSDTITYLGLKRIIEPDNNNRWALHYRFVAGRAGDICEALSDELGEQVPLLNSIIVNQATGLPSEGVDGYLARFLGFSPKKIERLAPDERDAHARQAIQTVFDYDGWPRVCRQLRLRVPSVRSKGGNNSTLHIPDPKKFPRGPESAAHKALKLWAMSNPGIFAEYGAFGLGHKEVSLSSGDRLDVYFENDAMQLAVEVKSLHSPLDEIERGVFQCVKYRSVLRAMQVVEGVAPNAQAVLVLDGPAPTQVTSLASLLMIRILDVGKPPHSDR
jgi:hypothetical protein